MTMKTFQEFFFSGKVRPFVAISVGAEEIILNNIVNPNWTERQDREAIQTFYIYTLHFFTLIYNKPCKGDVEAHKKT